MNIIASAPGTERFEIADLLREGRESMTEPQDLPGRYGRVVKSIDRVLQATQIESVLAGGWAVWRHGYDGRLTQDLDIVLSATELPEFLRASSVSGFEVTPAKQGRWPKLRHRDTDIIVDILPEGAQPGTVARPAPTTIPHPHAMGASPAKLNYISLLSLIELKLAAGRNKDETDVVVLIQTNPEQVPSIRDKLTTVHPKYVADFDRLTARASEDSVQLN